MTFFSQSQGSHVWFSHTGNRSSMPCSQSTELEEVEITKYSRTVVTYSSHRGRSAAQSSKTKMHYFNALRYYILDMYTLKFILLKC